MPSTRRTLGPESSAIPCRLDKFLRDAVGLSRRAVVRALDADRIRVNGAFRTSGTLIFEDDHVTVDGHAVAPQEPTTYVVLHKPEGIVTTTRDPGGRPCLTPWLAHYNDRTFPVGRLDRETTGLLLLTDDGDLAHVLLHPKHHVHKTYVLTIADPIDDADPRLDALREGVEIKGGPARALELDVLEPTRLRMVINEGRNRQVRRMARAVRLGLKHLHRSHFGPLQLDTLDAGETRALDPGEVGAMWHAVGGREAVVDSKLAALRRRADELRREDRPNPRLDAWLEEHGP